jgi:hypothetical protein
MEIEVSEKPSHQDRELLLKEQELKLREREVAAKEKEAVTSQWLNPVVLGLFAAALGLAGNIIVTKSNNDNTEKIEHFRAQSTLILEAIKAADTKGVCKNLTFFVSLGLLDDANRTIGRTCPEDTKGVPILPTDGVARSLHEVSVMVSDAHNFGCHCSSSGQSWE